MDCSDYGGELLRLEREPGTYVTGYPLDNAQELLEQRKGFDSDEEKARAWSETTDVIKTYSDEMIKRWKEEIDTLLVFVSNHSSINLSFKLKVTRLVSSPQSSPRSTCNRTYSSNQPLPILHLSPSSSFRRNFIVLLQPASLSTQQPPLSLQHKVSPLLRRLPSGPFGSTSRGFLGSS